MPLRFLIKYPPLRFTRAVSILDLTRFVHLVVIIDEIIKQLAELHIPWCLSPEIGYLCIIRLLLEFKTDNQQIFHLAVFRLFYFLTHRVIPLLQYLGRYGHGALKCLVKKERYNKKEDT